MPTAFISGASRGIGRAAALKLASLGYDLALNYHTNYEAAQNVQHEAQKYGVKVLLLAGDIADENNVREMFRKIGETFGGADVVVNNASFAEQCRIIIPRRSTAYACFRILLTKSGAGCLP